MPMPTTSQRHCDPAIQAARNFNAVSNKCQENKEEIQAVSTAITRLGKELRKLFQDDAIEDVEEMISQAVSEAHEGIIKLY